ncbi:cation-efflux pump [Termitidicoccus mucosus]|uniref:Cation transporter n=1 Tax=Termitidicoccus mucosus TaxID=1184151 RepID=A0A178IAE5_9BACT|nr:cation transporter [Opitutaceae bacterium TSB47]
MDATASHSTQTPDTAARKERVARWSVFASAALAAGKLVAGLLSGSLALLSEAAHALVDTFATLVTWVAVRASGKPADAEHHYGHGKFESVAALVETGILVALALGVAAQAVRQFLAGGNPIEGSPLVFGVLGVSIIVDLNRIRVLRKVARETGSHALAADALHFASDLAGSFTVLLGFGAAALGFRYGDTLAAILVAVYIAAAGCRLGKRTLATLLDTAPPGRSEQMRALIAGVPGVAGIRELRLRPGGNEIFGELAIDVARTLPLDRVDAIKARIHEAIRAAFPDTVLTVSTRPRALETETVRDRVMLIAQKRQVPVHHVTVQELDGRLSVSLDLEVDGHMWLGDAHQVASSIEAAIRDEFGPATEVETHIEPLEAAHLPGQDAPSELTGRVAATLAALAAGTDLIGDIHNVRVRRTPAGLVVNYHCRVDGRQTVAAVHDRVDAIEHAIRVEHPEIVRVTGHTDLRKNKPPSAGA